MEAYATNEAKRKISAVRSAEKEGADESATFYIFLPRKIHMFPIFPYERDRFKRNMILYTPFLTNMLGFSGMESFYDGRTSNWAFILNMLYSNDYDSHLAALFFLVSDPLKCS